ncbi:uncharacterized protein At5g19025-like [Salvia hispanica]|uniref:uncharacterized protein At5g19025-like n=1 Tax=Salvia hispanica TaxID=49212 RepID=UPI0020096E15|nr:uncharacterized protein At5g19025-like [Salvia hispanica]
MVCFDTSISVEHHIGMAKSVNSADPCSKSKQINHHSHKSRRNPISFNQLNIPACDQSRYAVIDVAILIAVIASCGFLIYPYARILAHKTMELGEEVVDVVSEEIVRAPMVFGCLGLSILFAAMALVAIAICTDNRCGKPGCRGLTKAAEFDIQLEAEESLKKCGCLSEASLKKGLFELPRDHHKELEAELKKMAPPNGRAVLVFRARCGCSVGRMEVLGPRRLSRKLKK